MMLNGWLTNLDRYLAMILAVINLPGFLRSTANGYSSAAATLAFAKEIQEQGRYCIWKNYNRNVLNFKEQDVPIAMIFTIDHNLTPVELKLVLDTYHAIACLLPDDSNRLYAVVSHLPKNPKLYFGKLLNIQKLHRSFEEPGDVTRDSSITEGNPCHLIKQTITLLNEWLSKAFFFEKVVKHIVFVNSHTDQCFIPKYFRELYYKDHKPHRWFVDKIILNVAGMRHSEYALEGGGDISMRLKGSMDRSIIEGTRLRLSTALSQQRHYSFNETVLQKSLTEFLREILLESVVADAIFSMDSNEKWIKYDFSDFKKHSHPTSTYENWTWLLSFLRVMFFIVGAFILLLTTCALCGFACMLSTIIRDDYYQRRQVRQREDELRNLEERFREAGMDLHLNAFDGNPEWDVEGGNEMNTAIERLSIVSGADFTQASSMPEDDASFHTAWLSRSHEQSALYDDEMKTILGTARSRTELHSAVDL